MRRRAIGSSCLLSLMIACGIVSDLTASTEQIIDLAGKWKFTIGDNPDWVDPTFNDAHWQSVPVPMGWSRYGMSGYTGFAWYRKTVEVPKDLLTGQQLAATIGRVSDCYEFYANGKLIGGVGRLPPNPLIDYDRKKLFPLPQQIFQHQKHLSIAIRVWKSTETGPSDGGTIEGSFLFGPTDVLARKQAISEVPQLILAVFSALVALYHLKLYRRRAELKEYFWFGLLGLDVAAYSFVSSQWKYSITDSFRVAKEAEYLFLYLMPPIFIQFLWPLLKIHIPKILRIYQWGNVALAIIVFVIPGLWLEARTIMWWEILTLPVIFSSLTLILREAWRGHPEARTISIGILFVLFAALNDIAVDRSLITTPRIITFGFGAFVITMTLSLSHRFTRIYTELDGLRKDLEKRVEERTHDLAEANVRLSELDQLKTRFFANISHEFRTPLTLTLGPLENAINGFYGQVSSTLKAQLELMFRNAQKLLRLINQLLDVSKLDAGKMKINAASGDIVKFVNDAVSLFNSLAERKKIELRVNSEKERIELYFDHAKMDEIIQNLLSNAIKFTPIYGKVLISIREAGPSSVEISVKDTGIGISEEELPHIFDRFYQVSHAVEVQAGSGIGLSLVKDLVTLHHGSVKVESVLGFGTEFVISLPVGRGHLKDAEIVEDQVQEPSTPRVQAVAYTESFPPEPNEVTTHGSNGLVLITEDNPDVRQYIKQILQPRYEVIEAHDGEEGLIQARNFFPDLIITDVMMPKMDGYQFCREVRKEEKLHNIPMILLTAKESEDMKIEGLESGADDYMSKPFSGRELLARAKNLIRLRLQEKELTRINEQLNCRLQEQMAELVRTGELKRFLPPAVVEKVLGGELLALQRFERRKISILCLAISEFSNLTESLEPEEVSALLNEYLREVTAIAVAHHGTVDKFLCDMIVILFGLDNEVEEHAWNAAQATLAIRKHLSEISRVWRGRGLRQSLLIRAGIATGYCTVGLFGSDLLKSYTAMGNPVDVAIRMQSQVRSDTIMCTLSTYKLMEEKVEAKSCGLLSIPGLSTRVECYEILRKKSSSVEDPEQYVAGQPEKIAHYRILANLGAGGMGIVLLARDTKLGRLAAIKVLSMDLATNRQRLNRFIREAKAASAINHENVAHIYEIGEEHGLHFIAMEYVEGKTLAEKMKELNFIDVFEIAIQLADALDEAHRLGIIHRDIKPANVMIGRKNKIKVLDFGLAKLSRSRNIEDSRDQTTVQTREGLVMGTTSYMSPEQTLGRDVDHRSDLFSSGIVFYEMISGRRPFVGSNAREISDQIVHGTPHPLRCESSEMERIVLKCLEKAPENRYQTAHELLTDLKLLKKSYQSI